jgi:molybdopterin/thiamine biosynthesis adenylyltransferase
MLTEENVDRLIADYDLVIDGTDTFETRYTLNDAAVRAAKSVVHASVFRFEGQLTVFVPFAGPCYRCLYPTPPPPELAPGCSVAGVLGVVPGVMGLLQATEAIKLILDLGDPLVGRLLIWDALDGTFSEVKLRRDPACPACGTEALAREAESAQPAYAAAS